MSGSGWSMRSFSLAVVASAMFGAAAVATAEFYRCVRPDGSTVYTDSQATCPGAREHQSTGAVQSYRSSVPARAAVPQRVHPTTAAGRSQTDGEASWRRKKHRAEADLSAVTARIDKISPFVKTCNRGGSVFRTLENGLRTGVSCSWLRDEVPKLERQRNTLAEYLDHGLRDECRKSGCLPGWLR
jgi:hypothetical protein